MISVCMATYNGERFIKEQLDSILCQLSEEDEIIISDDGSTDKTLEIIDSYNDKRIKVFHHKKEENVYLKKSNVLFATKNFENALKHAVGDYVYLSDQDDIWCENKIEETKKLLQKYDFVMSNFSIINDDGLLKQDFFYEKNPINSNILFSLIHPHFIGCCCCINRNLLKRILPFPDRIYSHDLWIGLIAQRFGTIEYVNTPLIKHRVGDYNSSTACKKSINSFIFKIKYRFFVLLELMKRSY